MRPGGGGTLLYLPVPEGRGVQPLAYADRDTARLSAENKIDPLVVAWRALLDFEREIGAGFTKNDVKSALRYREQARTTWTSGRRNVGEPGTADGDIGMERICFRVSR
jgi:hypothetical protein